MPKTDQPKSILTKRLIDAAFDLALEGDWRNAGLRDIADKADIAFAEAYSAVTSKQTLLNHYAKMVDQEVLADFVYDRNETVKDRLFDLIMSRFDAMSKSREALNLIAKTELKRGQGLICGYGRLSRSMALTLEAAGVSSEGLVGGMAIQYLSGVYLRALAVWMSDETEDFSKTMKSLDSSLTSAEKLASFLSQGKDTRNDRKAKEAGKDEGLAGDGFVMET